MSDLDPEYKALQEEIATLQKRGRCFDLQMARYALRIISLHNAWMTHALEGDRGCERAVAFQLDALSNLVSENKTKNNI